MTNSHFFDKNIYFILKSIFSTRINKKLTFGYDAYRYTDFKVDTSELKKSIY